MSTVSTPFPKHNPQTAQTILPKVGILVPSYAPGSYRTTCPACSPFRKPNHRKLKCLTTLIRPDGSVVWCCHHPGCGFKGPLPEHVNGLPFEHKAPVPVAKTRAPETWQPMVPPPEDAKPFRPGGKNLTVYQYHDMSGKVLCYVSRHDGKDGKTYLPWTYGVRNGRAGWHPKRGHPPLPLYNLDMLAHLPADWDVFLVEGEKAADALNAKLRRENYAAFAMTWQGGVDNVKYCDFRPLYERNVILWGDADAGGAFAMFEIRCRLPRILAAIDTRGLANGFDAADLTTRLEDFLKQRCR